LGGLVVFARQVCARQICFSGREVGEECRGHSCCEVLEDAHGPRSITVAEMNHREVEGAEAPPGHDFNKFSFAQQLGLNDGGKVTDACSCEQGCCQTFVLVDREVGLEGESFLILSVCVGKVPDVLRSPERESEKAVA